MSLWCEVSFNYTYEASFSIFYFFFLHSHRPALATRNFSYYFTKVALLNVTNLSLSTSTVLLKEITFHFTKNIGGRGRVCMHPSCSGCSFIICYCLSWKSSTGALSSWLSHALRRTGMEKRSDLVNVNTQSS